MHDGAQGINARAGLLQECCDGVLCVSHATFNYSRRDPSSLGNKQHKKAPNKSAVRPGIPLVSLDTDVWQGV